MPSTPDKTRSPKRNTLRIATRRGRRACGLLASLLMLVPLGCKKDEEKTPAPEVYVQAEHPEQGSISEQITADAILTPLAQARCYVAGACERRAGMIR